MALQSYSHHLHIKLFTLHEDHVSGPITDRFCCSIYKQTNTISITEQELGAQ
jgi:hypothetical protein